MIVPEGVIFQSGGAYKQLREMLVKKYLIAVISLPAGVFQPYSGVKTSILVMDRQLAKRADSVLFLKIVNDGFGLGAQRRATALNDLPDAARHLRAWIESLHAEAPGQKPPPPPIMGRLESGWTGAANVQVVEKSKIAASGDYNLSGDRYIASLLKESTHDKVALGDVCDIYNGSTPSKEIVEYWQSGTVPWFTVEDIRQNGRIIRNTVKRITKHALDKTSVRLLPKNTVLLCCTASVGEYAFTEIELTTNQQFNGLVVKGEFRNSLDARFLFHLASTFKHELIRLSGQTSFNFVSVKTLKAIEIPLPPLAVQQEIVAEIEGYQKRIEQLKQEIEEQEQQIKAAISQVWGEANLEAEADSGGKQ